MAKIISQSITQSLFFLEAFSIVSSKAHENKAEITSCMIFNPRKLCAISPYLQGWTEAFILFITQTSHNARNAIQVFCCLFMSNFLRFFNLVMTIKLYTSLVLKWLRNSRGDNCMILVPSIFFLICYRLCSNHLEQHLHVTSFCATVATLILFSHINCTQQSFLK